MGDTLSLSKNNAGNAVIAGNAGLGSKRDRIFASFFLHPRTNQTCLSY